MSNRIEDRARRIAEPFLKENGCRLWDVVFEKEGAMHYLRILFDNEYGELDIDKCEQLTRPLNKLMDSEEFIKQVDILEIGSPGITRRIRNKEHFGFCMGKQIKIMRRKEDGKTETINGTLTDYCTESKSVTLDQNQEIPLKKCIRITLEEQAQ
jgi:ribosome maturation factor RimP